MSKLVIHLCITFDANQKRHKANFSCTEEGFAPYPMLMTTTMTSYSSLLILQEKTLKARHVQSSAAILLPRKMAKFKGGYSTQTMNDSFLFVVKQRPCMGSPYPTIFQRNRAAYRLTNIRQEKGFASNDKRYPFTGRVVQTTIY